jgi:hypothetical protein
MGRLLLRNVLRAVGNPGAGQSEASSQVRKRPGGKVL